MVTVVVELSLVVDSHDILSSLRFLLCWGEVYCESMVHIVGHCHGVKM